MRFALRKGGVMDLQKKKHSSAAAAAASRAVSKHFAYGHFLFFKGQFYHMIKLFARHGRFFCIHNYVIS